MQMIQVKGSGLPDIKGSGAAVLWQAQASARGVVTSGRWPGNQAWCPSAVGSGIAPG